MAESKRRPKIAGINPAARSRKGNPAARIGKGSSPAGTRVGGSAAGGRGTGERLSHLDARGRARMVDVSGKSATVRQAVASARIEVGPAVLASILDGQVPKGDVLATARIAGIMAAKQTHHLIPLCHPLSIEAVAVEIEPQQPDALLILATCRSTGRTGVEMEALTAASVAALTIYDMCKSLNKAMVIGPVRLEAKTGGKSGPYRRK